MGWSPEQIAGRLRLTGAEHTVSHESIYRLHLSPVRSRREAAPLPGPGQGEPPGAATSSAGVSRSPTAAPSTSVVKPLIIDRSSAIGKATSCSSAPSAWKPPHPGRATEPTDPQADPICEPKRHRTLADWPGRRLLIPAGRGQTVDHIRQRLGVRSRTTQASAGPRHADLSSAIPIPLGSAAPSRMPTASCDATCHERPNSTGCTATPDINDIVWAINTTPRKCLGYLSPGRGWPTSTQAACLEMCLAADHPPVRYGMHMSLVRLHRPITGVDNRDGPIGSKRDRVNS